MIGASCFFGFSFIIGEMSGALTFFGFSFAIGEDAKNELESVILRDERSTE